MAARRVRSEGENIMRDEEQVCGDGLKTEMSVQATPVEILRLRINSVI